MEPVEKAYPISRGDRYDLRRNLVRKLQQATRGVPRSERFQVQRAFVEAWDDLAGRGDLGILAELVQHDGVGDTRGIPSILESLIAGNPMAGRRPAAVLEGCVDEGRDVPTVPGRLSAGEHAKVPRVASAWWETGQGDLFSGGLLAQPL